MSGIYPAAARSHLAIDGVYMPRNSDWAVSESRKLEPNGENKRNINGDLITIKLVGFDKYSLSWHCSGVRRHPAFDNLFKGRTASVVPIKEMEAVIMPGGTAVTVGRDIDSIFKVRNDVDFTLLIPGTDYTVAGRTITLAHTWEDPVTVQYKWRSTFKLDDIDADWDNGPKEAGWNMTWREV